MEHTQRHRLQKMLIAVFAVLIAAAGIFFIISQTQQSSAEDIPNPFVHQSSALKGSVMQIGMKEDIPVFDISLGAAGSTESLRSDAIQFVLTDDDSSIIDGAPLSAAFTEGKSVFGYKYTSRDAASERAVRDQAAADGAFHSFAEFFPGEFFTSPAQRANGTAIADFEAATGVHFRDLADVTLDRNARYIVISNDPDTFVQVRNFTDGGGDGTDGGGTDQNMNVCGNGQVDSESGEDCDDGNTGDGDGCSAACRTEDTWTCNGQPSFCFLPINDDTNNNGSDQNDFTNNGMNMDGTGNMDANGNMGDTGMGDIGNTGNTDGMGDTGNMDGTVDTGNTDGIGDTGDNGRTDGTDGNNGTDQQSAFCGNGIVEFPEQCDDGNDVGDDSCDNDCNFVAAPF